MSQWTSAYIRTGVLRTVLPVSVWSKAPNTTKGLVNAGYGVLPLAIHLLKTKLRQIEF